MIRRLAAAGALALAAAGVASNATGVALSATGVTVAATGDFETLGIIPYESPKPAPAFSLPDLAGNTVKLEDFRGKVLLLFFWATW